MNNLCNYFEYILCNNNAKIHCKTACQSLGYIPCKNFWLTSFNNHCGCISPSTPDCDDSLIFYIVTGFFGSFIIIFLILFCVSLIKKLKNYFLYFN